MSEKRFNYYWDWKDIGAGINYTIPHKCVGFKRCLSINLIWFSGWVYLFPLKTKK